MIYLVTKKQELFEDPDYTIITAERAIEVMQDWKLVQYDSETGGRNPRLCKLLCAQFGNDAADTRIVVDCETIDIKLFKGILESKLLVGHNLKFDLQFLLILIKNHNNYYRIYQLQIRILNFLLNIVNHSRYLLLNLFLAFF